MLGVSASVIASVVDCECYVSSVEVDIVVDFYCTVET